MISVQCLIDKINSALGGGGLTSLQTCQLNGALASLTSTNVISVATVNDLPDPAPYTGRMIYVDDVNSYRYSDGIYWLSDFTSSVSTIASLSYGWGYNSTGQLGDNTIIDRSSPARIVGINDWSNVSSGCAHTIGIRTNGTMWAWGQNTCGKLGDNSTTSRSSPVSVVGNIADWCDISAGTAHNLGVRTNGTMWAWGCNGQGRLGTNNTTNRSSPVSVVGNINNWSQASAGSSHSLGLRSDGTAWAWGSNSCGVLGDNSTTSRSSPVSVTGGIANWCDINAGAYHSLGIRTDGTIWAWGRNLFGQLGDGTVVNRSSPVEISGGFFNWCQISAGCSHNLALRTDGTAWAWGVGSNGRLGDETVTAKSSPVVVGGGFTDWCQIVAACAHSLGLRTNGTAWAWGDNSGGRLGDGTEIDRSSPVAVVGGFTDWCRITAGRQSIAIRQITRGF